MASPIVLYGFAVFNSYCGDTVGGKTIKVSQQVYDRLMSIKARNGHTTLDSVVRWLLEKSEVGLDPGVCEFMASGGICRLKGLKEPCDQEKWWLCKLRAKAIEEGC